jgi:endonuclease/exonuclease/phosphatase family metal-dependent hydrolase
MKSPDRFLPLLLVFLFIQVTFFQLKGQPFIVAFYNVENLFDIEDDPLIDDEDFLPGSRIPWTPDRYETKLDRLAQVLSSIDEERLPDIVGLCEVENSQVLEDLVKQRALKKGKYEIVHYNSPDERGIDNALLYNKKVFQVIDSKPLPVHLSKNPGDATRDILYVKGWVVKAPSDTLHIFVNHWPSRWGGQKKSEPKRIDAASTLRHHVDSIFKTCEWANVIAMGDFNDEPRDSSMHNVLKAYDPSIGPKTQMTLYNMMLALEDESQGTIYYKEWQVFDQIILSTELLTKTKGLYLPKREGKIFSEEWVLYKAGDGSLRPNRTAAKDYYGGYSDHLPVYVEFLIRNN